MSQPDTGSQASIVTLTPLRLRSGKIVGVCEDCSTVLGNERSVLGPDGYISNAAGQRHPASGGVQGQYSAAEQAMNTSKSQEITISLLNIAENQVRVRRDVLQLNTALDKLDRELATISGICVSLLGMAQDCESLQINTQAILLDIQEDLTACGKSMDYPEMELLTSKSSSTMDRPIPGSPTTSFTSIHLPTGSPPSHLESNGGTDMMESQL